MDDKPYIRNPKGTSGSKWGPSEQDNEDFEQEKRIQEWIEQQGIVGEFGYKYRNSKGNARNTLIKASVRLDQKISEDGAGTFADLIAGSDGRDLFGGDESGELKPEAREIILWNLSALGFTEGEIECLVKMLKLSILENKLHFEKSVIDSEW